jgi:transposase
MRRVKVEVIKKVINCPKCGTPSKKHSIGKRTIKDLGYIQEVRYSKHYCPECKVFITAPVDGTNKNSRYSNKVRDKCYELVKDGYTYEKISNAMVSVYEMRIPSSTIHNWITDMDFELATTELGTEK